MKAFKLNAVITSIRAKVDGSLGLSISTPELTPDEKVGIMGIQGINIDLDIKPLDTTPDEIVTIDKDLEQKTMSKRVRDVLWVYWSQQGSIGDFDVFYRARMLTYINNVKEKLEPQE